VKCHSDHNGESFSLLHWTPTHQGLLADIAAGYYTR